MIDAEDRELLMLWTVRVVGAALAVIGSGVTLGLAWRAFDLIKG